MNGRRRQSIWFQVTMAVLIACIVLAIAVPEYLRPREGRCCPSCQANLKQINAAKEQWAIDNNARVGDPVVESEVDGYIKSDVPTCPSGGTYTYGPVGTEPTCSIGGLHTL